MLPCSIAPCLAARRHLLARWMLGRLAVYSSEPLTNSRVAYAQDPLCELCSALPCLHLPGGPLSPLSPLSPGSLFISQVSIEAAFAPSIRSTKSAPAADGCHHAASGGCAAAAAAAAACSNPQLNRWTRALLTGFLLSNSPDFRARKPTWLRMLKDERGLSLKLLQHRLGCKVRRPQRIHQNGARCMLACMRACVHAAMGALILEGAAAASASLQSTMCTRARDSELPTRRVPCAPAPPVQESSCKLCGPALSVFHSSTAAAEPQEAAAPARADAASPREGYVQLRHPGSSRPAGTGTGNMQAAR